MKIKGGVLAARVAFVKEHFGADAWVRVLDALPTEDARALRGMLLVSGWFAFDMGKRLDETIVRVLGHGASDVFERIGAASADRNLTGAHSGLLTPGDPEAFLRKTDAIYGFYYDTGRRTYASTGPGAGVITTYDAETFSAADCLTVIGWYRRALEMCGASDVSLAEDTCRALGGQYCRYRVRWRPPTPSAPHR